MASIVYYTNAKTGVVSAYRSEAKWDPQKGYSVPKRTYLGRADPVTHEIIPSSHKRGRRPKAEEKPANRQEKPANDSVSRIKYDEAVSEIQKLRQNIADLQRQNKSHERKQAEVVDSLRIIQHQLEIVLSKV